MFSKKRSRPEISAPTNFEHRVHTGFDAVRGTFVGLPSQWASVVEPLLPVNQRARPIRDHSINAPFKVYSQLIFIITFNIFNYSLKFKEYFCSALFVFFSFLCLAAK